MKLMKKCTGAFLTVLLLVLPAGCSKKDGNSTANTKAGGNLVIYTGSGTEITDPILALFSRQNPNIKVEIIKAGSGELMARIRAEIGNPGGDLLIGGEPYLYESSAEVFEPYVSPTDKDMVISASDGLWHPWSVMLTPIAVNKDRLPNQSAWPTKLSDLKEPRYKAEKIAFCDPGKSGTGATIANNIASLYDWEFFTSMLDNSEVLSGSDPMFDAVKDGTYPIGFVNEDLGVKWLEVGLPIALVYPTDGVINTVDCLGIIKGAKNMDNAKLFVDFFGSPENHQILVNEVKRRSTRKDAKLAEGMTPTTAYKLIQANRISRGEITEKYNEAYEISRKK
ncbi:putative ABC transporter, substrate binding protein [Treponema primitia ZAS-2]|uniref:Putative ABC transporter, substrate binding protein n=1 Tax=Treponema primitia (strain ATCC BAA-887 / DSM 12427 / ZAS-2) TaxID=545694 RepID=F5YPI6_TREPZ|nr:extracellular solute-binding protein [Treponema primitia]AEF85620.1 putative ABC transporter, substrate binding protein [Treponema primitia ZAS-2]